MGSRITGALMTRASRTMANGLPTFSVVTSPNLRAPVESKRKLTAHCPVWSRVVAASTSESPLTMTRLRITWNTSSPFPSSSSEGSLSEPSGTRPERRSSAVTFSSSRWKVSFAVLPSRRLMRSGSSTPGSWTRMRSSPWRWIVGSRTPVSSMRRRMISIDWLTAASLRPSTASSVSRIWKPPLESLSISASGSRSSTASAAASIWSGLMSWKTTRSRAAFSPVYLTPPRLSATRVSSTSVVIRSRRMSPTCTSSSRWEPPCRSRPRLTWLDGSHAG